MNSKNKKNIIRGSTLKKLLSLVLTVIMILQIAPLSVFADAFKSDIWANETIPGFDNRKNGYYFEYGSGTKEWEDAGDKSTPVDYSAMKWYLEDKTAVTRPQAGFSITSSDGKSANTLKQKNTTHGNKDGVPCKIPKMTVTKGSTVTISDMSSQTPAKYDLQIRTPSSKSIQEEKEGQFKGYSITLTETGLYKFYYQIYESTDSCWGWGNFSVNGAHYIPRTLTPAYGSIGNRKVWGDWAFVEIDVEVTEPSIKYRVMSRYLVDGEYDDDYKDSDEGTLEYGKSVQTAGKSKDGYTFVNMKYYSVKDPSSFDPSTIKGYANANGNTRNKLTYI